MTVPIFDSQFHEAVLAIFFDFEAGKQNAETTLNALNAKLKEAEEAQNLAHQGKVLEYLGSTEYNQNKLEEARDYFERARRIYMIGKYERLVGMLDLNMGNIYFAKGRYERCKDYYLKAYSLAERYQYTALQSFALNNYGYILYLLGDLQQAQKTLEKAYALVHSPWNDLTDGESGNLIKYRQRHTMNVEENLALVALAQNRYQDAWEHAQRGLRLAIEHELKVNLGHLQLLSGKILSKKPELENSKTPEDYFQEASSAYEALNMPLDLCEAQVAYARSAFERGLKELAQELIAKAKKTATQAGLTKEMVEINNLEVLIRLKG
jgi:tetratricopeptide (TPR) repeat protein